jgi:sterol desaturase/sphingolipid hydroxylase (fatty acid hydroxylase superfamily)
MPSLLELVFDPVSLATFGIYAALIGWEALAPARPLPRVAGWRIRGLIAFAVYFLLASYLPLMWAEHFARWQIVDLTALGTWGGALAGFLVYQCLAYAWHRSMHASDVLWRGFHQMHHSAERLDTYSAFWFSPADMIGWTLITSVALTLAIGITPQAATIVMLAQTFFGIFEHANLRTPQWLGYVVQRPENHARHHARGVHHGNFADLSLLDMLFGTFHNPKDFPSATGFHDGASMRVAEMVACRDVTLPPAAEKTIAPARA